jgi:hypothetical protein
MMKGEQKSNNSEKVEGYQTVTITLDIEPNYNGYLSAMAQLLKHKNIEEFLRELLIEQLDELFNDPQKRQNLFEEAFSKWGLKKSREELINS